MRNDDDGHAQKMAIFKFDMRRWPYLNRTCADNRPYLNKTCADDHI